MRRRVTAVTWKTGKVVLEGVVPGVVSEGSLPPPLVGGPRTPEERFRPPPGSKATVFPPRTSGLPRREENRRRETRRSRAAAARAPRKHGRRVASDRDRDLHPAPLALDPRAWPAAVLVLLPVHPGRLAVVDSASDTCRRCVFPDAGIFRDHEGHRDERPAILRPARQDRKRRTDRRRPLRFRRPPGRGRRATVFGKTRGEIRQHGEGLELSDEGPREAPGREGARGVHLLFLEGRQPERRRASAFATRRR